ncbi:MAG TPA: energy transducer TonB, partial [Gemmatimonadales bacterium]|nr:energy transducer TonB [Gemmatimonadales bacterium]
MRAISSAVSITVHVAVGAAVLFGTTKTGRSNVPSDRVRQIVFPAVQTENRNEGLSGIPVPGPIAVAAPDLGPISIPSTPQTGATGQLNSPAFAASDGLPGANPAPGWDPWRSEENAEVLTAPLPTYPELLRQAGVQGKVVLEAVVDTTGRVLPLSISVVSATNPGFVAPA